MLHIYAQFKSKRMLYTRSVVCTTVTVYILHLALAYCRSEFKPWTVTFCWSASCWQHEFIFNPWITLPNLKQFSLLNGSLISKSSSFSLAFAFQVFTYLLKASYRMGLCTNGLLHRYATYDKPMLTSCCRQWLHLLDSNWFKVFQYMPRINISDDK